MASRITIIDGHPDPDRARFVHALAAAYDEGAREEGREARLLTLADLDFPLIRTRAQWESAEVPPAVALGQDAIRWADHVVFLYPLWHGDVPAYLKAYLEQLMRPGFAIEYGTGRMPAKLLKGRSARIIVTMGMPTIFYRVYYGAHAKSFRRNILNFGGISPVETTPIGNFEDDLDGRIQWLDEVRDLGRQGR